MWDDLNCDLQTIENVGTSMENVTQSWHNNQAKEVWFLANLTLMIILN